MVRKIIKHSERVFQIPMRRISVPQKKSVAPFPHPSVFFDI